ncbi:MULTISPECIES: hypothetical protein [Vibrio]|uniref:hypothetical protein n=1 Tax=Vibrio TaxID=662 RepID=UPI00142E20BB|nr:MULTISPECIES: hypothetical protein [Vibrio]MBN3574036.1 hypothetical protein [Vibrio neptunius]MCG9725168.1 hypothetical protein [Vibrio brasiliensis]QXX09265.1 hypothetical protein KW548_19640 [Vibrio neptunius]
MAIKSSTFGRLELSGEDAKQFAKQVREAKVNPHAKKALARGREALAKMRAAQA